MANVTPELKPLTANQRQFVHLMTYQGLDKIEAYSSAFKIDASEQNLQSIKSKATNLFFKPHVNSYYHAIMEEIREREIKKGVWTKEVATEKLVKLIEHAEGEIYDEGKQLTMGRLNAIILPAKELNTMNGFNQTNINVEGCVVQITGEAELED